MYKRTRKKVVVLKVFCNLDRIQIFKCLQVETRTDCEDFGSFDSLDFFTMQTTTETTEDDTTIELPDHDEVTEEIHNDIVEGKSANQRYL